MKQDTLKKAGIVAAIALMPGGFVLGATLAARYWRKRRMAATERNEEETP